MPDHQPPRADSRRKASLAAALRRVPFLMGIAFRLWRLRMPRFTAGVVGVIVNDAGRVLVLEHVFHIEKPWGLPGGWLNRREDPENALARELMEELGLPVVIDRFLLAVVTPERAHLDFAYQGRPRGAVSHLSAEILDYVWADPADLPPLVSFHQRAIEAAFPALAREACR